MSFNKGLKCSILSPIYRFEWETKPGEESPSKQKELVIYPKVTGKMTPSVVKGRKRAFNSKHSDSRLTILLCDQASNIDLGFSVTHRNHAFSFAKVF